MTGLGGAGGLIQKKSRRMTISPIYSYIIQHIAVPCNAGHDKGETYNIITQFKADFSSITIACLNVRWMAACLSSDGECGILFLHRGRSLRLIRRAGKARKWAGRSDWQKRRIASN
jgi:hypothetical protein